jgi:hypothetical protein
MDAKRGDYYEWSSKFRSWNCLPSLFKLSWKQMNLINRVCYRFKRIAYFHQSTSYRFKYRNSEFFFQFNFECNKSLPFTLNILIKQQRKKPHPYNSEREWFIAFKVELKKKFTIPVFKSIGCTLVEICMIWIILFCIFSKHKQNLPSVEPQWPNNTST